MTKKKPKLDFQRAVQLAEEVVSGKEDFVYSPNDGVVVGITCTYERDGQPSCVVGQIFARLGVPVEELKLIDKQEHPGVTHGYSTSARVVTPYLFETDEKTVQFLNFLQRWQDNGASWGEALNEAKTAFDSTYAVHESR